MNCPNCGRPLPTMVKVCVCGHFIGQDDTSVPEISEKLQETYSRLPDERLEDLLLEVGLKPEARELIVQELGKREKEREEPELFENVTKKSYWGQRLFPATLGRKLERLVEYQMFAWPAGCVVARLILGEFSSAVWVGLFIGSFLNLFLLWGLSRWIESFQRLRRGSWSWGLFYMIILAQPFLFAILAAFILVFVGV